MNREQADQQIWQFKPIYFEIYADQLINVDPFIPSDINIVVKHNKVILQGNYGIDIFRNHRFVILVNGIINTYTKVEDIPSVIDNVIGYYPDDTHDITFTYTFSKNNQEFTYTHWVHHDMSRWETFLPELMKRETNGGWAYASSN